MLPSFLHRFLLISFNKSLVQNFSSQALLGGNLTQADIVSSGRLSFTISHQTELGTYFCTHTSTLRFSPSTGILDLLVSLPHDPLESRNPDPLISSSPATSIVFIWPLAGSQKSLMSWILGDIFERECTGEIYRSKWMRHIWSPVLEEGSEKKITRDGYRNRIWAMEYWLAPLEMECNLSGGSMNDYQVSYLQDTMEGF